MDVAANAGSFGTGGCAGAGADHKYVGAGAQQGDSYEGPDPEGVAGWGAGGGGAAAGDGAGGRECWLENAKGLGTAWKGALSCAGDAGCCRRGHGNLRLKIVEMYAPADVDSASLTSGQI